MEKSVREEVEELIALGVSPDEAAKTIREDHQGKFTAICFHTTILAPHHAQLRKLMLMIWKKIR